MPGTLRGCPMRSGRSRPGCGPSAAQGRAHGGNGRRARRNSEPNGDGHQLGRWVRIVIGHHEPRYQAPGGARGSFRVGTKLPTPCAWRCSPAFTRPWSCPMQSCRTVPVPAHRYVVLASQDVEAGERPGTFRIARRVARDRVISTVDPPPAGCASCLGHWTLCARRLVGARTNRGPGRPGPRCRCQATMPLGSMTYLRAAPLSKSW
jgi:hypothetical protein